ncbi:unnamed protein product [Diamesa hyperborea]
MNNKTADVKHLSIRDSVAHYLPRRLDLLFNLTSLLVFDSSLLKIESEDFIGLEQLEYLHLGKNFLTVIPNDAFYRLPHLKLIVLRDNHIKELVSDLFKNNLQLEHIWMYNNHIKSFLSIFLIPGLLNSIQSNFLKCTFNDKFLNPYHDSIYGCFTTKLRIMFEDKTYDGYTGEHLSNKNSGDVNFLQVSDSIANYLPRRLDLLFNLTGLNFEGVKLLKIRSKAFIGLKQLEYLNLGNNYLTVLPHDAFYRLPQLKTIILQNNHIQELSSKIFRKNLKLERIMLNDNHIKYIGQETFTNLKQLIFVELSSNKCLSHSYVGNNSIQYLNKEVRVDCENKIESTSDKINRLRKDIRKVRKVVMESMKESCDQMEI